MHFYQLASMVESGGMDLEKCLQTIRDTSQDLMEILDKAMDDSNRIISDDVVCDLEYKSLFEPLEVNTETLIKIRGYLETPVNNRKTKKIF